MDSGDFPWPPYSPPEFPDMEIYPEIFQYDVNQQPSAPPGSAAFPRRTPVVPPIEIYQCKPPFYPPGIAALPRRRVGRPSRFSSRSSISPSPSLDPGGVRLLNRTLRSALWANRNPPSSGGVSRTPKSGGRVSRNRLSYGGVRILGRTPSSSRWVRRAPPPSGGVSGETPQRGRGRPRTENEVEKGFDHILPSFILCLNLWWSHLDDVSLWWQGKGKGKGKRQGKRKGLILRFI